MGVIGTELIDEDQHVHVTLHETTADVPLTMCGAALENRALEWCK